ncbi:GTPase-activating protein gyp1 [Neolecta irregularis DAH-3]|uniref:GTPase-activating protein gyp1 n=1 Tax=Neolecta irregularis (strain DAH-3) TaxID=1198029 RepID=A0A1U7LHG9_NEOID|nr:GTPase-activating protein gyp1 [Neolecta irregularis DAH-3]|eukprot:OLL22105.1 GTPase-activating protein gyp1 [Neolecta irregularis DAH-3]
MGARDKRRLPVQQEMQMLAAAAPLISRSSSSTPTPRSAFASYLVDTDDDWAAALEDTPRCQIDVDATAAEIGALTAQIGRADRFSRLLKAPTVDLQALRALAWSGVPPELRPVVWPVLLGHAPTETAKRTSTLAARRQEYYAGIAQALRGGCDSAVWHQIHIDVLRTHPTIALYQKETTKRALERILYLWAIRHPESGYVQGINDLATPFFQVFLSAYTNDADVQHFDPAGLPKGIIDVVEADTFWCLSSLLATLSDHYIHGQPGIQRQITSLRDLTRRIDTRLASHLEHQGVEFIQFSFRWMNCLLMREFNVRSTIRMWDTYLSEGSTGFSQFHLYVCAAFLVKWSKKLLQMDFQSILMFLQSLPTKSWTEKDIELLLSEAFMWQSLYADDKLMKCR